MNSFDVFVIKGFTVAYSDYQKTRELEYDIIAIFDVVTKQIVLIHITNLWK